jgi:hypothetical protein
MTTLKRSAKPTTRAPKAKAKHEVRCAILNGSASSVAPICRILRLADEASEARQDDVLTGLLMALEVLTCLPFEELQRQLTLPRE